MEELIHSHVTSKQLLKLKNKNELLPFLKNQLSNNQYNNNLSRIKIITTFQ
jgi:hypothetical protein